MTQTTTPLTRMRGPEWIEALEALCRRHLSGTMTMVEIGSFSGESTEVFARHLGTVHAIDPWHESYQQDVLLGCANGPVKAFVETVGLAPMSQIEAIFDTRTGGLRNVIKRKGYDHDVVTAFPDASIDFIYIDSIHTFEHVTKTVSRWRGKVRSGGIIGGHDYCPTHWDGVVRAVNEAFGTPDEVFADTSWIVLDAPRRLKPMLGAGARALLETPHPYRP